MGIRAYRWGTKIAERGSTPVRVRVGDEYVPAEKGYHVALSANRESILKHGIDYRTGETGSRHVFEDYVDAYGFIPRKGNYIWLNKDDALGIAKPGIHDIWEVAIPESRRDKFFYDRSVGGGQAAQSPTKIPKRDLTLHMVEGPINPEHMKRFGPLIERAKNRLSEQQFRED